MPFATTTAVVVAVVIIVITPIKKRKMIALRVVKVWLVQQAKKAKTV